MEYLQTLTIAYECESSLGNSLNIKKMTKEFLRIFLKKTSAIYATINNLDNKNTFPLNSVGKDEFYKLIVDAKPNKIDKFSIVDIIHGKITYSCLYILLDEYYLAFVYSKKNKINIEIIANIFCSLKNKIDLGIKACKEHERLKLALLASNNGLWDLDLRDNSAYFSPRWKEIIGYKDHELKNDFSILKELIHPDDIDIVLKNRQENIDGKTDYYKATYRLKNKNGSWTWVLSHGKAIFDEYNKAIRISGVTTDITQQKESERNLKTTNDKLIQKKNELETIIQEAPNPMILHDEDGTVLILNQAWIDSSGFSLEEILTIDDWVNNAYVDEQRRVSLKKHIDSLYEITEKLDEGEFTFLSKNKKLLTWQVYSAPLGLINGKRAIITSAMDITELKRKDEMLIHQSRNAAMGEMISMIAHQWRQPLSAISTDANNIIIDIALENFNTSEAEKYANSIVEYTQHLSKTIDDFRNFFKPDKVISQVNIRETIDTTLSIVKNSLKNNNIELTSSYETDKKVKAYPRELMQVFVNIINNSKDVLTLNKPNNALIAIRVYEDKKYINTEICDNGGGIDVNILPKIFDPYFSTKDAKTGTGLGLYMSKMIIENHLNGAIEVYNKDKGACFTVRLLKEV